MKKATRFLLLVLMLIPNGTDAQKQIFDVLIGEKVIGQMVVTEPKTSNDLTVCSLSAEIDAPFFARTILLTTTHHKGVLHSSMARKTVSGDIKEEVKTIGQPGNYTVTFVEGKKKKENTQHRTIAHTTLGLYYTEPVHITQIYSERFGQMASLRKTRDNQYQLTTPDGNSTFFTYLNGKCVQVQSSVMGMKLTFRIRKQEI